MSYGNAPLKTEPELNGWVMKFSAPGKVFKDVSFANPQVGYIVTELGEFIRQSMAVITGRPS